MTYDEATWTALALALSVAIGVVTFFVWRSRGPVAGLRGVAWTLLPLAALLTGTLRLLTEILSDVGGWATRLVFSPTVWAGVIVAGAAALLFVGTGLLRARRSPEPRAKSARSARSARSAEPNVTGSSRAAVPAGQPAAPRRGRKQRSDDAEVDDDIDAILRRHGIS